MFIHIKYIVSIPYYFIYLLRSTTTCYLLSICATPFALITVPELIWSYVFKRVQNWKCRTGNTRTPQYHFLKYGERLGVSDKKRGLTLPIFDDQ